MKRLSSLLIRMVTCCVLPMMFTGAAGCSEQQLKMVTDSASAAGRAINKAGGQATIIVTLDPTGVFVPPFGWISKSSATVIAQFYAEGKMPNVMPATVSTGALNPEPAVTEGQ